jgi:hypothetical protein
MSHSEDRLTAQQLVIDAMRGDVSMAEELYRSLSISLPEAEADYLLPKQLEVVKDLRKELKKSEDTFRFMNVDLPDGGQWVRASYYIRANNPIHGKLYSMRAVYLTMPIPNSHCIARWVGSWQSECGEVLTDNVQREIQILV